MDLSAFVGKLLEVAGLIGADRNERTPDRTGHRHGYRMRTWDTWVGTIELAIPKVRPGTYFPSLLQPRRRAEHALWVDATYHKVRVNGRVPSQATVVAIGVTSEGERQVLGIDAGPSEDRAFWTAFLRSLVKRGLRGVRLVVRCPRGA
jgi:transposase-like protein